MIDDDMVWVRVIDRLEQRTRAGKVQWTEGVGPRDPGRLTAAALLKMNRLSARTFKARVEDAIYELSSGDAFGLEPFELKIWEDKLGDPAPPRAVKAINTNTDSVYPALAHTLRKLYRTVDRLVESEEDTAARLLRDLDGL